MRDAVGRAFLHVTCDAHTAEVIAETLRRLGREETVIGMRAPLASGPLPDVDSGGALLAAWWRRILDDRIPDHEMLSVGGVDDTDLWREVVERPEDVVLWHGPHPSERLVMLRGCWQLRDQAARVYDVALPPKVHPSLAPFYGAAGIVGAEVATREWARLAKVPDVAARAQRWEELRSGMGECIRVVKGEDVEQLPITAFDSDLVGECADGAWTRSDRIVASILAENPVSFAVLVWRMRELIRAGTLEGRGEENEIGLPKEVRSFERRE